MADVEQHPGGHMPLCGLPARRAAQVPSVAKQVAIVALLSWPGAAHVQQRVSDSKAMAWGGLSPAV